MYNPGDSVMNSTSDEDDSEPSSHPGNEKTQDHLVKNQGDPNPTSIPMDAEGTPPPGPSRAEVAVNEMKSPSNSNRMKGILKNKEMKSPVAPNALNYSGPAEPDVDANIENYEEDARFSTHVDSKELYAKKVMAGLVKKRRRNSSIESAPELSFRPKRDESGDKDEPKGPGRTYKPPFTV